MIRRFLTYNYQYLIQKKGETKGYAWFISSGFIALALTFNILTLVFTILTYFKLKISIDKPGYILFLPCWIFLLIIIGFNKSLKNVTQNAGLNNINQNDRVIFWIYYIITIIIYAYAVSYFSQNVYTPQNLPPLPH